MEFSFGLDFRLKAFPFSACVFPVGKVVGPYEKPVNLAPVARNTERCDMRDLFAR